MAPGDSAMPLSEDEFVRRLVAAQGALRGFILAQIRDVDEAEDVLQDVSVVLWKKLKTYETDRPFLKWALGVAYYEVLHSKRDRARRREVLDAELLEKLALRYESLEPELESRRRALRHCLDKMPENYREVVQHRYVDVQPIGEIARRLGKSDGAVQMLLMRIRLALMDCANRSMAAATEKVRS